MFKVGDRVKCVEGCGRALKIGDKHTVRVVTDRYLYLAELAGGWYHERFKPVVEATARANDPATCKGKRKVNKYEQAVLFVLYGNKRHPGYTGKEIAEATGNPLNCITPRFAPLRRKGLIKDSGVRRDKQIVWVLC